MGIKYKFDVRRTGLHVKKNDFFRETREKSIGAALRRNGLALERRTKELFPLGATGEGRESIHSVTEAIGVRAVELRVKVVSTLPYVAFVERGTGPHTPPISPLKRWARAVLGDEGAAYAVRAKIRKRGTRAQRPFRRAEEMSRVNILRSLRRSVKRWEFLLSDKK